MKETESRALCTSESRTNTWGWTKKRGVKKKKKKKKNRKRWEERSWMEEEGGETERCGYFIIQSRIRDKLGSDRSQHIGCEFQIMCCLSVSPLLSSHPNTRYQLSPSYLSLTHSFFVFLLQRHSTIVLSLKVRLGASTRSVSCGAKNISTWKTRRDNGYTHRWLYSELVLVEIDFH